MKAWKLKLVREGHPDIYVHYRKDKLPELISAAWLQNHSNAIMKIVPDAFDATYKFVNGPMVYLRSIK